MSEQAHHRVFKVRKIKVEKRNAAVVYHCLLLQCVSPIHMCLGPNANHQMPLKCKCFLEDVWYRPMKNGAGEEAGAKL